MCEQQKKTLLVYGLTEEELAALTAAGISEGVRCRAVEDTQTVRTVEELLSGKAFPPAEPVHLPGKYALMDGFKGCVGRGVALISGNTKGVIKAMHTKHNSAWRFADLCAAIQEENDAMVERLRQKQAVEMTK